jgi:stage II sporulation protein P
MIRSSNNYSDRFNFFDVFFSLSHIDINNPNTILQSSMFYKSSNDYMYVVNEKEDVQADTSVPLVYIYNTHDTEEYSDNYGVYDASFYLKDKLSELGISSIVEENRTSSIRSSNGWNYNLSYKASRINLERVKSEYPSIRLFIDLHRDSVGHNSTFINIGDKDYAKVLFVIGREHANYLENLHYTQSIDYLIGLKYPGLSKGILEKEGPGVNGIYNQDIGYNVILLEVGGNENSSIEVKNTLDAISSVIKEKIYEEN